MLGNYRVAAQLIPSLQSDLQDVEKKGETANTHKEKSAFTRKHMDSHSKCGFIQSPNTD
jgi:hypothetical protein